MQDWLVSAGKICKTIETLSSSPQIHKSKTITLAGRVKTVFDAISSSNSINRSNVATAGYLSMLLATFEEIYSFLAILQKKDKALGKRVKRFGCDEETFSKWNETLETCCTGLGLVLETGLFDADLDLRDFSKDIEDLQLNLTEIFGPDTEKNMTIEATEQLISQQQLGRTQYKTQQAVKAEKQFDVKLIRYEKIIGRGGIRSF
jgi:hypothetical protein